MKYIKHHDQSKDSVQASNSACVRTYKYILEYGNIYIKDRKLLLTIIEGRRRSLFVVVVRDKGIEAVDHHFLVRRHHCLLLLWVFFFLSNF